MVAAATAGNGAAGKDRPSQTETSSSAGHPPSSAQSGRSAQGQNTPGQNAPGQPAPGQVATAGADAALGQVVWLMMNTPAFRHMFLADLEWMVLPPILLGQFRILYDGGKPVAFAAWGHLSEEAEARLQQPNPRLKPDEWKSGDRLWLVSVIAPFGHGEKILTEIQTSALSTQDFKYHRRGTDGNPSTIVSMRGK